MSQSLTPLCTPLKQSYDSCFNSWFEGYLEPAIAASETPEQRAAYSKQKASEFQERCGKIWEEYRACVQVGVFSYGVFSLFGFYSGVLGSREGKRVG